jgi:outer membrane receptor for Fe3+-dicitrate
MIFGAWLALLAATGFYSEASASEEATKAESRLETIHVLGASRFDLTQPTAPTRVSKKKLESLQTTNVAEALKSAPGG